MVFCHLIEKAMNKIVIIGVSISVLALVVYVGTQEERSSFQVLQSQNAVPVVQSVKDKVVVSQYSSAKPAASAASASRAAEEALTAIERGQNTTDAGALEEDASNQKAKVIQEAVKAYREAPRNRQ